MMGMKWLRSNFLFVIIIFLVQRAQSSPIGRSAFAKTSGTHFVANNKPLYLNGFNAYWMLYMASDPSTKDKVTSALQQASKYGMNVARTWAFSDGVNDRPLQISPGVYNEASFKGLDFVISEASKNGVYVILSLVNNFKDYGGRAQYVQWARERGQQVTNDDDFYTNPVVKGYYKNHIKAVLTRINSITGVAYKNDPAIFAWELINEPLSDDHSGAQFQGWVSEMAAYVKSVDKTHLLEIGLEGYYGPSRKQFNPSNFLLGTDFISNNLIPEIDFSTIHLYPEPWLPNSSEQERDAFVDLWIQAHVQDSNDVVKKPLVIAEFGKSSRLPGFTLQKRDSFFAKIYNDIYSSVVNGKSFTGGLFWQVMAQGMDGWGDGYQVVLEQSPSTANIIAQQSRKLGLH